MTPTTERDISQERRAYAYARRYGFQLINAGHGKWEIVDGGRVIDFDMTLADVQHFLSLYYLNVCATKSA